MKPPFPDFILHRPSLRAAKVAALLEVDRSTIYKMIHAGILEAHGVGKRGVRVFADSVREYQEQRTILITRYGKMASQPTDNKGTSLSKQAYGEAVSYLQSIGCL